MEWHIKKLKKKKKHTHSHTHTHTHNQMEKSLLQTFFALPRANKLSITGGRLSYKTRVH